ncbi:MAG: hypothetical protein LBV52_01155 [Spirochaetaceae bacterium]|nr:hypothetical protein [Spirochaetaceae bacterium]
MNTGHTIFNETVPTYTVLGGTERLASTGLSVILLNRGGRYPRKTYIDELKKQGFDYIVSVESQGANYEIEQLADAYPFVRFILLKEMLSVGEMINIAALEIKEPLFFVLWNDFHLLQGLNAARIAEKLLLKTNYLAKGDQNKKRYIRLCTVPVIQNSNFETLPLSLIPKIKRKRLEIFPFAAGKEGDATLYPYDAVGIYDKERFLEIGGFDTEIKKPYWQIMDFGMRAWLWGEQIRTTQLVRLRVDGEIQAGDSTADDSYRRFFLKNLAVSVKKGIQKNGQIESCASIPWTYFLQFMLKTGIGFFAAKKEFSQARLWIKSKEKRFTCSPSSIEKLFASV